jgi:hypothetical protein
MQQVHMLEILANAGHKFWISVIWICFGFRYSHLEFARQQ